MDPSIPKEVGSPHDPDADPLETREWIEALDALIEAEGSERATFLLRRLLQHARTRRVPLPQVLATPYVNTISLAEQPPYPGNLEIESRISSLVRWNALALVVRANRASGERGGGVGKFAETEEIAGPSRAVRVLLDTVLLDVTVNLRRLAGAVRGNGSIVQ